MLLSVIRSGCAKFETGQTFEPSTPNISFVPYLQSVTQQCWIRLHSSSNFVGASHAPKMAVEFKFTKSHGVVSFPLSTAGPNIVGFVASIFTPLTYGRNNLCTVGPTMLEVAASVCQELNVSVF